MKRTWMVTGASRGLGAKTGQAILAHGDNLVATARKKDSFCFGADWPSLLACPLDVSIEEQAKAAVEVSSLGGYQASAGWGSYGSTKFAVEGITEALDFMDGSSLQRAEKQIQDYATTVGQTRAFAEANNGRQPGDPAKLGEALLRLVALPDPPLGLPPGSDAVSRIVSKNSFVEGETERWKALSESADLTQGAHV